MSTLLRQEQPTFGSLAGNGRTFEVPSFQRDYSWDKEEWEDLWLDILNIEEDGDHYMGYVVLQETKESKHFIIIDGQQRITTISLLIIAVVQLLSEKGDKERAEGLRNTYLSSKELHSLIYKTKLKLNRNNDFVYSSQLLQLLIPKYTSAFKPSEKRLINAYRYFFEQVSEYFKGKSPDELTAFVSKKIDEKLFFTSIIVNDDLNAYKVFETLNARGVKLSTADLLKNYLLSRVYAQAEGEVEELEKKWYRINDLLGKFDVTTFIRYFWNSRNFPGERKPSLFKTIKKRVDNYQKAVGFINDLNEDVPVYVALFNSDSEIWTVEQSSFINELNILEVTQCFSLLMVAKQKFTSDEFTKLLRDVVVISFRYNTIGGQNPNELERIYGKASVAVITGVVKTAREVFLQYLKDVYRDDYNFRTDFTSKSINTNKSNQLAKYILGKLEEQYGGGKPDLGNKNLTIEHILPEHPDDHWAENFQSVDIQDYIFRLGNLTLLEVSKNKEAGRKSFAQKQEIYEGSTYKLSNQRIQSRIWNVESITTRQKDMASKALTIWKINYQ